MYPTSWHTVRCNAVYEKRHTSRARGKLQNKPTSCFQVEIGSLSLLKVQPGRIRLKFQLSLETVITILMTILLDRANQLPKLVSALQSYLPNWVICTFLADQRLSKET